MSKQSPLNVAVVGCGCVAGYGHLPTLIASDEWRCVAFVDIDRSRAEDFARRCGGGEVYEDYRYVLGRPEVDVVAVLTLPSQHGRIAIEALEAGQHVFTEKPMSHNTATAGQMIAAARRTGRKLFVGFLLRYTRCYQQMAEVIHAGLIGRPAVYRMIGFERYAPHDDFSWNRALNSFIRETSPGFDCGSHYVDLMRWYSGAEAVRVQGIGGRLHPDVPEGCFDWEAFHLEFDDGSRGLYETGWGFSFPGNRLFKEAIGPQGYVGVRLASVEEGQESMAETVFCPVGGTEQVLERSPWKGFAGEWSHFARMVREDLDPYPALQDALASLRIVEAGHRSAQEGVVVWLR
jgi:predicted dehydrogenase